MESTNIDIPAQPDSPPAPKEAALRITADQPGPFITHLKKILVPLDFSQTSLKALHYAVPFARQFGAKITLAHIAKPPLYSAEGLYPEHLGPEQLISIKKDLQGVRDAAIPPDLPVDIVVRYGHAFEDILAVAREIRADLLITTTHGYTGLKHMFLGSTAENVVRRASCPVLVVREVEHDFV
jgi:nucleotide-binding universal stress UspA family protein